MRATALWICAIGRTGSAVVTTIKVGVSMRDAGE
jgi:hypothetical protein